MATPTLLEVARLELEEMSLKQCVQNDRVTTRRGEIRARVEYLTAPHWMNIKK